MHRASSTFGLALLIIFLPNASAVAVAQPVQDSPAPKALQIQPTRKFNSTGKDIPLTAPLRVDEFIAGEIGFTIHSDDMIDINSADLIAALHRLLDPTSFAKLKSSLVARQTITPGELATLGYQVHYNSELIALDLSLPPNLRPPGTVEMNGQRPPRYGGFDQPAGLTGYVNMRSSFDYVWSGLDKGVQSPYFQFDGVIRAMGLVLESEANLTLGTRGDPNRFQREGTRLVYDDVKHTIRWTAGDLVPLTRGFGGTSQMAGLSLVRSYSTLDPARIIQPTGSRTVVINRPSTLHALVNGQSIQDIRLQPGVYNLRDFPFSQGSNDVHLVVEDNAGLKEELSFSLFFDQSLLDVGLSEFGLFAGIDAPSTQSGRQYNIDTPTASGYIRHGFTDRVTAGFNFNARARGAVLGTEFTYASPIGTIGANLAVSKVSGIGTGYAFNFALQHVLGRRGLHPRSLSLTTETRSVNFATPTESAPDNRFDYEVEGEYTQPFGNSHSVALSARYSHGRGLFQNELSARARYSHFVSQRLNLNAELLYEDRPRNNVNHLVSFRINLTYRLGRHSRALAQYDTKNNRVAAGYEISGGQGVGAWSVSALAAHSDFGTDLAGSANYTANRADLGFAHSTEFSSFGARDTNQRTSARLGTALVFAGGHIALSRPVYDSFALAVPHQTLKGRQVELEPRDGHYIAKSGLFGGAVEPSLGSYFERRITYDVPDAPSGYDLGPGNIRVKPPYRSGYLITAGSDYSVIATGTLYNAQHMPIALLAGKATELDHSGRSPLIVFTNRAGRFGVQGLRPGRWLIEMPGVKPISAIIDIPKNAEGVVVLGDVTLGVQPVQGEKP